ncbi:synaptotagmin-like protein 1 isoform 1-T1 [Synchiropus picturatus]
MATEDSGALDLSHLTEAEQATILQVLQRDLELRRHDEGRIRRLLQRETDFKQLQTLSGAWFNDERNRRHLTRMSGSDLVYATIRHHKRTRSKVTDVPLASLFDAERAVTTHHKDTTLEADNRLCENKLEIENCQGSSKSAPTKRKNPVEKRLQHLYLSTSPPDCDVLTNGHSEESEEDLDGQDHDKDSLKDTETAYLKLSSSSGSLHSNYTLNGSMMSLFSSGVFGVVDVQGRMQFSLVYDTQKEELAVRIYRCEGIASGGKSHVDAYVKTYLLPDKSRKSKRKTVVKKKTENPVYDQTLKYKVRNSELRSRTLNMSVWHSEPLGSNVFLGEVEVPLGLWDWTCTEPLWQELQPRFQLNPETMSHRGTLMFSVKFVPEGHEGGGLPLSGELHIWLREAQGLLSTKGGAMDSYVKSYILPDASCQSGQKTRVVKRSVSPSYNHTMVYDGFQPGDLREACAELTVWHRDGTKTLVLGGIRLSSGTGLSYGETVSWMDSTEEEISVWTAVINNPNTWVDTSLPIRANLTHRSV